MKINTLVIPLLFIASIEIGKAQINSKFNRPMIDLNPKPQVTTAKLPDERRKLPIFPKSMVKYVVSKPYSKVRSYSSCEVTPKKLVQRIVPKETKNIKTPVTSLPIGKYTTFATTAKRLYISRTQLSMKPTVEVQEETDYEREEDEYVQEPSSRYNVAYGSDNNLSSFDETITKENAIHVDKELSVHSSATVDKDESIDLEAVESNESNKIDTRKTQDLGKMEENKLTAMEQKYIYESENEMVSENKGFYNGNKEEIIELKDADKKEPIYEETESKELTNHRKKRLSLLRRDGYNNLIVSKTEANKEDSDVVSENNDGNEFIFIRDYLKIPFDIKKSPNYEYLTAEMDDSEEIATEVAWLEEYNHRPERSINIIEEENLGTTVAGFKFTGREPRIDSDLVFRNINA